MYTVYILKDKNNKYYKGLTNNIVRRLKEHKSGHTITTSKMKDIELIYKEEYVAFNEARAREKYFKTAAGRKMLKKLLNMDG